MNFYKYILLISLVGIFFGCRSAKNLTTAGTIKESISAKQIIKENQRQTATFNTLQAKVKIDYIEGERSNGVSVNLRIEKDKVIWLSAPFGVARAMITPEKVRYYNKLENEYFDGGYALLSELLGVELDFNKVQNLLMGETLFNLKDETYLASNNEVSYILQPENQQVLFEIFYLMNPGHFKLDSQQLSQPSKKRFLEVDYKTYQLVDKQIFPEMMSIVALEKSDQVKIDLEFKSVSINEEVRFPFEIPSEYKEIELK